MKKNFLFMLLVLLAIQPLFAQVPSYVPTNGLVGYWPFNGNANDESGNGNNGTNNGATLTTDRFGNSGKAYNFNGTNNFILVPSNTAFNSNDISVSMWVSSSNIQRQIALIRLTYSNASNEHFGIAFNDINQYGVEIAAKYNNPSCTAGLGWKKNEKIQNIMDNNFHHVVGTISGNIMKLYIDGMLANTLTTAFSQTSSCWNGDIQIGRNWSTYTNYFNGKLDDIGIWNRALTQQEITNLYNSVNSNECLTMVINSGPLSTNPVTYASTVNIFPNPANDQITIDCGNLSNVVGWNIKITNALGQQVFAAPMNTQQYVVPLNSWSGQGMYFVKILNAQNEVVNIKKIILQ
ncbi:MAG: LamG-like jellyroll fold domain-containing protein [Flavobacterium sp.]|jgi:hypothetical protein